MPQISQLAQFKSLLDALKKSKINFVIYDKVRVEPTDQRFSIYNYPVSKMPLNSADYTIQTPLLLSEVAQLSTHAKQLICTIPFLKLISWIL